MHFFCCRVRWSKCRIRAHLLFIFASWPRKTLCKPKTQNLPMGCRFLARISFAISKIHNSNRPGDSLQVCILNTIVCQKPAFLFQYLQNFFLIICIPIINIGVSTGTIWTWLWWCHKSKLSPSSKGRRLKLTFHCPMEIAMAIPGLHQLWVTMEVMPKWQRRPGHSWRFLRINVISTWRLSPLLWMAIQKFSYGSGF